MALKVGFIMDPVTAINYKKDSTLAMIWACQKKGWQPYFIEIGGLWLAEKQIKARCQKIDAFEDPNHFIELSAPETIDIAKLDVVLMRKDPPFNMAYIYCTYLLEIAEKSGVLVANKPQSLRDCNEKLFATHFPQCCPPLMVSSQNDALKSFHEKHTDVIFKPLDGMGGASIFRLKHDDPNVSVIIETLTNNQAQPIMAQKYIPEITDGDKRILVVDGEVIPYGLARIPAKGETRGNLAAGGSGRAQALSENDLWIANEIAPTLKDKGILFAGLDVIGDYLTEINVTSPTCIREIDAAFDTRIAERLMDSIERHIKC